LEFQTARKLTQNEEWLTVLIWSCPGWKHERLEIDGNQFFDFLAFNGLPMDVIGLEKRLRKMLGLTFTAKLKPTNHMVEMFGDELEIKYDGNLLPWRLYIETVSAENIVLNKLEVSSRPFDCGDMFGAFEELGQAK
jgi:hypothetical protein